MFKEICESVISMITREDIYDKDISDEFKSLRIYLALNYGFDPNDIKRVMRVKLSNNIPDIILILSSYHEQKDVGLNEYTLVQGDLCKIVMINYDAINDMSFSEKVKWICRTIYECNNHISFYLNKLLDTFNFGSLPQIVYYANAVMMISVVDKLFYESDRCAVNAVVPQILSTYYSKEITSETVESIRKAINDAGLSMLLDNCVWVAVDPENYPKAKFASNEDKPNKDDNDETNHS